MGPPAGETCLPWSPEWPASPLRLLACTITRMTSTADRLLEEALKLEPDERARIVAELLATLALTGGRVEEGVALLPRHRAGATTRSGSARSNAVHGRQRRGVRACPGPTREIRSGVGSPPGEGRPPLSGGDRRARRSGPMVPSPPARAGVRIPCRGRSRPATDRKFAEGVSSIARLTGRSRDPPGLPPSFSIRADLHGPRRTHQDPRGGACEETARLLARSGGGRVVSAPG